MDFIALAQECAPAVAHQTLAAIVKTESGFKPLAIGVNRGHRLERQPVNVEEAVVTAQWLIDNGYNIDMGLGQVNSANLKRVGLSVKDAFDPCKNLAAAASILQGNYEIAARQHANPQAALYAALSAYNTGSFTRGFENGYVQKVVGNAGVAAPAAKPVLTVPPIPLAASNAPKPAARPAKRAVTPAPQFADFEAPVRLQIESAQAEAEAQQSAPSSSIFQQEQPRSVMVY